MGRNAMAKLDKHDQRIANIFGTQDVPEVDTETLDGAQDVLSGVLLQVGEIGKSEYQYRAS